MDHHVGVDYLECSVAVRNMHSYPGSFCVIFRETMNHDECQKRQEIRSINPDWSPKEYWRHVRQTIPPYFWNRIVATKVERIPDEELELAIEAANGDVGLLIGLIRQGGKREVRIRLCEWCNERVDAGIPCDPSHSR